MGWEEVCLRGLCVVYEIGSEITGENTTEYVDLIECCEPGLLAERMLA